APPRHDASHARQADAHAHAPRTPIAPPLDMTAPAHDAPAARKSGRMLWLAAAAVAVIAVAGISLPAVRKLVSPAAPTTEGTLVVNTNPPGAKLFVDGVERGATPLTVALKPGPHSLEVRGDGTPRLMPITITAGAQVSQYLELPKAAAAVGQLHVRTEPAGARISVDGVVKGNSPLTVADLTPGEHAVQLESDLGSVKQVVTIEAGNTASLMVPLGAPEGAPVSGWIALSAPAEVQLFEKKQLIGTSQSDRVMVSAGRHELELVNDALGFRAVRTVQVSPGKVAAVKVEFPKGTIALNAIPWAEVWVDGEKIGETPIGNLQVTIGTHDILFRHPDLGEQRHKATVSLTAPARLSVDMRKK
ncbi:MAG TPA: PEGA domain-containing protein, partial [Vicinamibacterales bacterium]